MEYIDRRGQAQFDHSHLQNSKLKFQKGHWAKLIYHYTSIGGLESILRNKTLRFTNIKYMNDKDEVIAGLDSIAKIKIGNVSFRRNDFISIGIVGAGIARP